MASLNEDAAEVVNDNGRKLPKVYPRRIARVFINFKDFKRVGKGFYVFRMARVRSNGKCI